MYKIYLIDNHEKDLQKGLRSFNKAAVSNSRKKLKYLMKIEIIMYC